MTKSTTMTKAWRTDRRDSRSGVGASMTAVASERPAMPRSCGARGTGSDPVGTTDLGGWRRVSTALVAAGRGIWDRLFVGAWHYEEGLERFAAEIEISHQHEAIEAALMRLARRIAPSHRIELIHRRGPVRNWVNQGHPVAEFSLRFGNVDHGILRLHQPEGKQTASAGERNHRRLAMACRLAACAFERARLQSVWEGDGEETIDQLPAVSPESVNGPADRKPGVVRDATFLNAVLPFALAQARRHGEPLSLLCLQLDRLAAIRDLLGSSIADELVRDVAETASSMVRSSDIVARLDDDRVIVLLVRALGASAVQVASKITDAVADRGIGKTRLMDNSVAIGVAEYPTIARDAEGLLDAADRAMSQARAGGSRMPVLASFEAEDTAENHVNLKVCTG